MKITLKNNKTKPYLEALPDILRYQLFTKSFLALGLFLLGRLFRILLKSAGRVAVTSGDFLFLFRTWQGILILIVALTTFFVYVTLDLNAMIILSKNLLTGKKDTIWTVNEKGSQKHFLCSKADALITDNVSEAMEMIEEINNRSDLNRIIDRIQELFS